VSVLAIDINDAGIAVADATGVLGVEPGFAVIDRGRILTGDEAVALARPDAFDKRIGDLIRRRTSAAEQAKDAWCRPRGGPLGLRAHEAVATEQGLRPAAVHEHRAVGLEPALGEAKQRHASPLRLQLRDPIGHG